MFNTKTSRATALLILGFSTLASAQSAGAGGSTGPLIELTGPPVLSETMRVQVPIFRQREAFGGLEAAQQVADRLLSATRPGKVTASLSLSADGRSFRHADPVDGSAFLRVDRTTGDISFNRGMQDLGMELEADTPDLPQGQDAVRTALVRLMELDLMPEDPSQLVLHHVGGLGMSSADEEGSSREFRKLVTVHLGRRIGGLEVGGPGSKIVVHLGEGGRLVGLHRRWTELEVQANDTPQLVRAEEVERRVREHLDSTFHLAKAIRSEAPELGLFDDGRGVVEATWFFATELTHVAEGGVEAAGVPFVQQEERMSYLGTVSAVRKPIARLRNPILPEQPQGPGRARETSGDDEPGR